MTPNPAEPFSNLVAEPPEGPKPHLLPVDHVDAVFRALAAGQQPDEADCMVFRDVYLRWQSGMDWDQAIGIRGPLALAERNKALCAAAAMVSWGRPTAWELAGRLLERLKRFETERWPRVRRGHPPRDELDAHLSRAFRCGKVPGTKKMLASILSKGNSL